ncbi:hypothetical protein ACLFKQ_26440 [Myxosarcina sp. GI1(2024)]
MIDHKVTKAEIITVDNHQVEVLIPRNVNYILEFLADKNILISFELPKNNSPIKVIAESLQQNSRNIAEVTFTEFIQIDESKKVELFVLQKDRVRGKAKLFDGSEFSVVLPFDPSYAIDILGANNVWTSIND